MGAGRHQLGKLLYLMEKFHHGKLGHGRNGLLLNVGPAFKDLLFFLVGNDVHKGLLIHLV